MYPNEARVTLVTVSCSLAGLCWNQKVVNSNGVRDRRTLHRSERYSMCGCVPLYIDPVECIDCGACVPVCPISAIFALDDLPEKWATFAQINADHFVREAK